MLRLIINILPGTLLASAPALAHHPFIQSTSNLRAEGIPPISASVARIIQAYTDFRPKSFVA